MRWWWMSWKVSLAVVLEIVFHFYENLLGKVSDVGFRIDSNPKRVRNRSVLESVVPVPSAG